MNIRQAYHAGAMAQMKIVELEIGRHASRPIPTPAFPAMLAHLEVMERQEMLLVQALREVAEARRQQMVLAKRCLDLDVVENLDAALKTSDRVAAAYDAYRKASYAFMDAYDATKDQQADKGCATVSESSARPAKPPSHSERLRTVMGIEPLPPYGMPPHMSNPQPLDKRELPGLLAAAFEAGGVITGKGKP